VIWTPAIGAITILSFSTIGIFLVAPRQMIPGVLAKARNQHRIIKIRVKGAYAFSIPRLATLVIMQPPHGFFFNPKKGTLIPRSTVIS
jgi:hypothetical protein